MTFRRFLRELKTRCENIHHADEIVVNEEFAPINHYKTEGNKLILSSCSYGAYSMWDLYGTLKNDFKKEDFSKIVYGDDGRRFTKFDSFPLPGVYSPNEPVLSFKEYCEKYKNYAEPSLDICVISTQKRREYLLSSINFKQ